VKLPIVLLAMFFAASAATAQPVPVKENGKWGFSVNGNMLIPTKYDTAFAFDSSGRVCLACQKVKSTTESKFIKITSTAYSCNYLNSENDRLIIRNRAGDTCGVFALAKTSIEQYTSANEWFTVTTRSKKFLVTKDFRQLTFKGYHNVWPATEPQFYVTEVPNAAESILTGVVNLKEEQVVPNSYTSVRFNSNDSLIVACSAGLGTSTDDIYSFEGKRLASYPRHVEQATKSFVIHKFFEPSEFYIVYDIETRKERKLDADELKLQDGDEVRIRIRNEWFLYNLRTDEKKPLKQI
jgi:hypothetical protein